MFLIPSCKVIFYNFIKEPGCLLENEQDEQIQSICDQCVQDRCKSRRAPGNSYYIHPYKEEDRNIIGNVLCGGRFESPRDICSKAIEETGNHNAQETCNIISMRETKNQCLYNNSDQRNLDP